ncbi:MAG: hemerythrin domain-containing protein [Candidatus Micrarchaeia archaeon]
MANDGIQILIDEHIVISRVLVSLRKAVSAQKAGKSVDSSFFADAGDFAAAFADKCHHAKEEKIFFPLVVGKMPQHKELVERFLAEHVQGRGFVKQMRENAAKGDSNACAGFAEQYFALLTQHIAKENVLFRECQSAFPEGQKEELFEAFEKVEKEEIGEGVDEKYRALADELGKKANSF